MLRELTRFRRINIVCTYNVIRTFKRLKKKNVVLTNASFYVFGDVLACLLVSSNSEFHLKIKGSLLILRDQPILNKHEASLPLHLLD